MKEEIVMALANFPAWLQVILLSAVPITEYQFSIPFGIYHYHFSPLTAFLLSLIGATCIFFPLYFGLETLRRAVARYVPRLLLPFDALLARAEHKLKEKYARYGMFALMLFLFIPFPLTGVWTASLAAVALKIPFRQAAIGILVGMTVGAAVVTLVSMAGGSAVAAF